MEESASFNQLGKRSMRSSVELDSITPALVELIENDQAAIGQCLSDTGSKKKKVLFIDVRKTVFTLIPFGTFFGVMEYPQKIGNIKIMYIHFSCRVICRSTQQSASRLGQKRNKMSSPFYLIIFEMELIDDRDDQGQEWMNSVVTSLLPGQYGLCG
ncbi:hypothetical protein CHS0354_037965 [Potamilus streckersoni]|uniref:Uncharacterized protein n=1 Tax=Potamilus streckersoni TaxID=2493646 RepID=A0AAE0TAI7_9BIVA|nr:hypothetical protein CHS0354_037965 [Potamilus streckersoni]